MNQHVSPRARILLQELNRTRKQLIHEHEGDEWFIGQENVTSYHRACTELLWLCALESGPNLGYRRYFSISAEGRRILADASYVPIILRKRHSQPLSN